MRPPPEDTWIVPIAYADMPAVAELLRHVGRELDNDWQRADDAEAGIFIGSAVATGGLLFAARVDRRLVGFGRLERRQLASAPIGIFAVHVLAPYRRQGLGERLLRVVLETPPPLLPAEEIRLLLAAQASAVLQPWPGTAPITQIWLSVDPQNTPAVRLYGKHGFVLRPPPPLSWHVPAGYATMVRAAAVGGATIRS